MSLVIRNLSDQLVDVLRNRILSGAVPGDRAIRQDVLASELGVSKIPLREALARLEEEGLVQSQANRGFFVRPLNAAEAREIFDLRLRLEPDATARGAAMATEADHAHARDTFEKLCQITEEHDDTVGAVNRSFHRALFRPGHQPVTATILERLQVLAERYVRVHLDPTGRDGRANEEHREMLEAWLSRDETRVGELVDAHIRNTLTDLDEQLGDT